MLSPCLPISNAERREKEGRAALDNHTELYECERGSNSSDGQNKVCQLSRKFLIHSSNILTRSCLSSREADAFDSFDEEFPSPISEYSTTRHLHITFSSGASQLLFKCGYSRFFSYQKIMSSPNFLTSLTCLPLGTIKQPVQYQSFR